MTYPNEVAFGISDFRDNTDAEENNGFGNGRRVLRLTKGIQRDQGRHLVTGDVGQKSVVGNLQLGQHKPCHKNNNKHMKKITPQWWSSTLNLHGRQTWASIVSNFIFLASAHEGGQEVSPVSHLPTHTIWVSELSIAELFIGCRYKGVVAQR